MFYLIACSLKQFLAVLILRNLCLGPGAEREEDNWQAAHADHFPGSSFLGLAAGLGLLAVSDPPSPIGLSAARVRAAWQRQQRFLT